LLPLKVLALPFPQAIEDILDPFPDEEGHCMFCAAPTLFLLGFSLPVSVWDSACPYLPRFFVFDFRMQSLRQRPFAPWFFSKTPNPSSTISPFSYQ